MLGNPSWVSSLNWERTDLLLVEKYECNGKAKRKATDPRSPATDKIQTRRHTRSTLDDAGMCTKPHLQSSPVCTLLLSSKVPMFVSDHV